MSTYESKAYAVLEPNKDLVPHKYQIKSCGPNDAKVRVLYCGICHSDIHMAKNEWFQGVFPMVPGHEIIGIVDEIGEKVTKVKVGEYVGIGCMVDSCGDCDGCNEKYEQFCPNLSLTYGSKYQNGMTTYGGYGTYVTANEHFLLKIPDNLDKASAAPLLCAGITVFSPMVKHNMNKPGFKLAVIGLGGLGHMAVKFGVSFGCEVTVITRSEKKRQDALNMGAKNFVRIDDKETIGKFRGYFNGVIDTVSSTKCMEDVLGMLSNRGIVVCVGAPPTGQMNEFSSMSLILGERTITGSQIGSIEMTQEMLEYCGKHNITSSIELIKLNEVNTAFNRVLNSDVKYRFVIDVANSQNIF
ncbi:mannitol dehydrogenase zinc dependent alcohol dehydrogenase like rossmann fold [Cryptosporidium bovis]|uniref:mannitol dehydrogenase zinc dependent alcohol dehydrogenase like rossmann fold n=1 Tax=Cryptosporidium bovis TaxID=310047 RepID=UPI00351A305B|nr:mannitol dehydrogenase zinc dependent alcohol dehydrogenase like rossmann fold [Cryptosporidium bovis]